MAHAAKRTSLSLYSVGWGTTLGVFFEVNHFDTQLVRSVPTSNPGHPRILLQPNVAAIHFKSRRNFVFAPSIDEFGMFRAYLLNMSYRIYLEQGIP